MALWQGPGPELISAVAVVHMAKMKWRKVMWGSKWLWILLWMWLPLRPSDSIFTPLGCRIKAAVPASTCSNPRHNYSRFNPAPAVLLAFPFSSFAKNPPAILTDRLKKGIRCCCILIICWLYRGCDFEGGRRVVEECVFYSASSWHFKHLKSHLREIKNVQGILSTTLVYFVWWVFPHTTYYKDHSLASLCTSIGGKCIQTNHNKRNLVKFVSNLREKCYCSDVSLFFWCDQDVLGHHEDPDQH